MRNPVHDPFIVLDARFREYLKRLDNNPPAPGRIAPDQLSSDEYLKAHYLPPRPDPNRQPSLYKFWRETLLIPMTWPAITIEGTRILALSRKHRSTGSRGEQSANWSGAVARTFDYSHVTSVQGRWTVPTITLEPGTTTDTMCSMWIGLDGNDPASRSLPQIGTAQLFDFSSGAPQGPYTVVWWEWFLRDGTTNAYLTLPVTAEPGDHMRAILTRIDATTVNFFILNENQLTATPFQLDMAGWSANRSEGRVEANTAEWILERPRKPGPRNAPLCTMPNFDHASFRHCLAGTESSTAPELDLSKAKLLRLVDWRSAPPGSRALSTPKRTSPRGLNFKND